MGHRRHSRGLTRRGVLLTVLALLLALSLGGAKLLFEAERAGIEEEWDGGGADATLDRALMGVRAAFASMAGDAGDCARLVASVVEDLDLAEPPAGPDVERLFHRIFSIDRRPEVTGIVVLDRTGRELAWDGRVQRLGDDLAAAAAAGEPWTGILRSDVNGTIAAAVPFTCDRGLEGIAVAFMPFDVTYPMHNRYLPRLGVEEALAKRLRVARVRITDPAEARPLESRSGGSLSASLALGDGRVVASVEIAGLTREGRLALTTRREAAWTACLGAALSVVAAILLLVLLGRIPLIPRAPAGAVVLVLTRIALLTLHFPRAVGPDALLDPTDFATTHLGGLLGNPGELLLTALTAAGVAALATRLAIALLNRPDDPERLRHPVLAVVAALIGVAIVVPMWTALCFLVRSMVFDSTLDYVAPQAIWPEGPLLVMLVGLFLFVGAFLLLGLAALLPAARLLARIPRCPPSLGWTALASLMVALFSWTADPEDAAWLPWVAGPLLAAVGHLVQSGRVRRFPAFLALAALPGTTLAFAVLAPVVADAVRSDLRSEVREAIRDAARGPDSEVRRLLGRATRSDAVRSALRPPVREAPRLAFHLWARSSLSARGIDCDIEVRDPAGFVVSHWEMRMPPGSWLPKPRLGRSETRIRTEIVEGIEGAAGRSFLVGSGPVFGEDGAYLGTILVRVPTHGGASWGRAPPEILRNVEDSGSGADRGTREVSWFRGDRLVESTDPRMARTIRAPEEVVVAIHEQDRDVVWRTEERDGESWLVLYAPWDPPGDPEAEPGLLAASLPRPGVLEILRFFLKLMLVSSILALVLYAGHLAPRWRRLQFRFQHKLLLSYLILSALPVALLARVNTELAEDRFRESMEDRLRESLAVLTKKLGRGGQHGLHTRLPDLLDESEGIASLSSEWCKAEGWRLNRDINVYVVSHLRASSEPGVFRTELFSDRLSGRAFLEVVVRKREFFARRESAGDYSFLTGYTPLRDPDNDEVIGAIGIPMFWRQGSLDRELARQNATLLAIYLLTLILVVFMGIFFSRRISSPIERLAEATHRLGGGDLTYRIPRGARDEFGELVDSFNRMAEDLADSRERIVRAEKDAAWREMARQVAHEIKNPLTPMKLAAQQILRAWDDRHPDMDRILRQAGETIVRQVENLRRIASDFGDFARISEADARPIQIDGPVKEALALYAGLSERGIAIESDLADGVPRVRADPADLKRVMINLLQNASQALQTQGGGTIRVTTRATTVRFEGEAHPFVEVTVADDGPGIPAADLHRVFEPNFSTRSSGTGLGLAICRQIVEGLHGRIRIDNAGGGGATVRMSLPALTGEG